MIFQSYRAWKAHFGCLESVSKAFHEYVLSIFRKLYASWALDIAPTLDVPVLLILHMMMFSWLFSMWPLLALHGVSRHCSVIDTFPWHHALFGFDAHGPFIYAQRCYWPIAFPIHSIVSFVNESNNTVFPSTIRSNLQRFGYLILVRSGGSPLVFRLLLILSFLVGASWSEMPLL